MAMLNDRLDECVAGAETTNFTESYCLDLGFGPVVLALEACGVAPRMRMAGG
jgi:hypothetical protein